MALCQHDYLKDSSCGQQIILINNLLDMVCTGVCVCVCVCVCVSQCRSLRDSTTTTLRRAQRRSFTPASFIEEDFPFPDELDTSFFARVRLTLMSKSNQIKSNFICT